MIRSRTDETLKALGITLPALPQPRGAAAEFPDSPNVINGASDLFVEIFGDAGRHVRAAIGVSALLRNALVELQMTVEV
jgi:enamine deaminase RidA (YjgF/YER057c/UK114 family)